MHEIASRFLQLQPKVMSATRAVSENILARSYSPPYLVRLQCD
jgi:hypothetical protein